MNNRADDRSRHDANQRRAFSSTFRQRRMRMSRQEVISMVNQLSENQLAKAAEYIRQLFDKAKERPAALDAEQNGLLDLLNSTIDSGRGDFAEQHDHYLYGKPKQ
jgi:hypothetical protein